jgi:hypothetical protein
LETNKGKSVSTTETQVAYLSLHFKSQ